MLVRLRRRAHQALRLLDGQQALHSLREAALRRRGVVRGSAPDGTARAPARTSAAACRCTPISASSATRSVPFLELVVAGASKAIASAIVERSGKRKGH